MAPRQVPGSSGTPRQPIYSIDPNLRSPRTRAIVNMNLIVLLVLVTVQVATATKQLKRQFPFHLGDETTELVSRTHTTPSTTATTSRPLSVFTSRPQSTTSTSPLSQTTYSTPALSSVIQSTVISVTSLSGVQPTSTTTALSGSSTMSSSKSWKVIGIAVICITVVGVIILSIVFYDQWSRFVKDVLCGKKREPAGVEELLPEEKNDGWAQEFRNNSRMSNIRYPAQILSPPMAAQPLTRAASQTTRPTLLQRLSSHGYPFQQLSPRNAEQTRGLGIVSPSGIHSQVGVGEIYPSARKSGL